MRHAIIPAADKVMAQLACPSDAARRRRFLLFARTPGRTIIRVEIDSATGQMAQDISNAIADIRVSDLIDEREFDRLKASLSAL